MDRWDFLGIDLQSARIGNRSDYPIDRFVYGGSSSFVLDFHDAEKTDDAANISTHLDAKWSARYLTIDNESFSK